MRRNREAANRVHAWICVLEIAVVFLAVSGVLATGH